MKREIVVLPGVQLLCSGCGYALRAVDGRYRHGDTHFVLECLTSDCPQYEERLRFELQRVECEVMGDGAPK